MEASEYLHGSYHVSFYRSTEASHAAAWKVPSASIEVADDSVGVVEASVEDVGAFMEHSTSFQYTQTKNVKDWTPCCIETLLLQYYHRIARYATP